MRLKIRDAGYNRVKIKSDRANKWRNVQVTPEFSEFVWMNDNLEVSDRYIKGWKKVKLTLIGNSNHSYAEFMKCKILDKSIEVCVAGLKRWGFGNTNRVYVKIK